MTKQEPHNIHQQNEVEIMLAALRSHSDNPGLDELSRMSILASIQGREHLEDAARNELEKQKTTKQDRAEELEKLTKQSESLVADFFESSPEPTEDIEGLVEQFDADTEKGFNMKKEAQDD